MCKTPAAVSRPHSNDATVDTGGQVQEREEAVSPTLDNSTQEDGRQTQHMPGLLSLQLSCPETLAVS